MKRGFPLRWPDGRGRTPARDRREALFRDPKAADQRVSLSVAEKRLSDQFDMMTKVGQLPRVYGLLLSTNIRFTKAGTRDQNYLRDPDDPGAAVYFELDDRPYVLACDRWDRLADNIAAIAAHVDALRGQERWGVADLAQAFAGHVALPAPEQWWQVLELTPQAAVADIEAAWRRLARAAHPDSGGSDDAMARINGARDAGRRARG